MHSRRHSRGQLIRLFHPLIAILYLLIYPAFCQASDPGDAIVVLAAKFADGTEWGTGTFVDHDGLILTADHVIHRALANPLSTTSKGFVPTSQMPISITIYSSRFAKPLTVDVTGPGNILGGAISNSQWMDAAFVRATLNPSQRGVIQPLDISLSPPGQREPLTAWGPHCSDMKDPKCYAVDSLGVTLSSNPTNNLVDYQVRANLALGFSGGPLTNAAGMIVGIASWGIRPDGSPGTGTQIVSATYLSGPLISRKLSAKLSASSWLVNPAGCTNTTDIRPLTAIDTGEMFPENPASGDCPCCCSSLSRSPNSTNTRIGSSSCAQLPGCLDDLASTFANSVQLAANTGTIDAQTVKDYSNLRDLVAGTSVATLPKAQQSKLYDLLGSTGTAITLSASAKQFPALSVATQDALVAFKMRASFDDSPVVYGKMQEIYAQKGDEIHAADAGVMADFKVDSPGTKTVGPPDIEKIKRNLFDSLPDSVPLQVQAQPIETNLEPT